MAWIESHSDLENHPKLLDLMNEMNWSKDEAIGKLHRLWWWCMKYADDGDLRKHNDARLSGAMGVIGRDASKLRRALVVSGWIDITPYDRVHDWWDYAKYGLMAKYKKSPDKWHRIKELYKNKVTVPTTVTEQDNQTKPYQTKPYQHTNILDSTIEFENIWNKYPNKDGKKQALKSFKASVKTERDKVEISNALDNYLKHLQLNIWKKPKNGSTWFNNWRDWINWIEPKENTNAKTNGGIAPVPGKYDGIGD